MIGAFHAHEGYLGARRSDEERRNRSRGGSYSWLRCLPLEALAMPQEKKKPRTKRIMTTTMPKMPTKKERSWAMRDRPLRH